MPLDTIIQKLSRGRIKDYFKTKYSSAKKTIRKKCNELQLRIALNDTLYSDSYVPTPFSKRLIKALPLTSLAGLHFIAPSNAYAQQQFAVLEYDPINNTVTEASEIAQKLTDQNKGEFLQNFTGINLGDNELKDNYLVGSVSSRNINYRDEGYPKPLSQVPNQDIDNVNGGNNGRINVFLQRLYYSPDERIDNFYLAGDKLESRININKALKNSLNIKPPIIEEKQAMMVYIDRNGNEIKREPLDIFSYELKYMDAEPSKIRHIKFRAGNKGA